MKITVFTSNQARHLNLINSLASVADEVFAVMEANTIFPGRIKDFYDNSDIFQSYFNNVIEAENKIFGNVCFLCDNINSLTLKSGDLNHVSPETLAPALDSDLYIIFGASYIKGWLVEHLVKNRAINIHMGVSPYYRGSSCNFWSLYDDNPHLCGATIHLLSKGLDSGEILYHALPTLNDCETPFDFTMRSVLAAHQSLVDRISDKSLFDLTEIQQDKQLEVRYTRNSDFTDEVANTFLNRKLSIKNIDDLMQSKKNESLYLRPYYF